MFTDWYLSIKHHKQSWLALLLALVVITSLQLLTSDYKSQYLDESSGPELLITDQQPNELKPVPQVGSIQALPEDLQKLARDKDFDSLREALLEQAMQAVESREDALLAKNIALLGLTALEELDTDSAAIYLHEALDLYEELGDELGAASVSLQIGRMHIVERRQARRAALAYDSSMLARWKIAHGRFTEAEPSLRNAIQENIALNRHGAAAVDYETLYRGYLDQGNMLDAEEAALRAAHLHAESGRPEIAHKLLEELQSRSLLSNDVSDYSVELQTLHKSYEDSVNMIAQAQDYTRLYNHYIEKEDPVRAWRFRLKANSVQQQASKRARYRRQSGVLVLLYNSNDSMRRAHSSLARAQSLFVAHDHTALADQSVLLMREVF